MLDTSINIAKRSLKDSINFVKLTLNQPNLSNKERAQPRNVLNEQIVSIKQEPTDTSSEDNNLPLNNDPLMNTESM